MMSDKEASGISIIGITFEDSHQCESNKPTPKLDLGPSDTEGKALQVRTSAADPDPSSRSESLKVNYNFPLKVSSSVKVIERSRF